MKHFLSCLICVQVIHHLYRAHIYSQDFRDIQGGILRFEALSGEIAVITNHRFINCSIHFCTKSVFQAKTSFKALTQQSFGSPLKSYRNSISSLSLSTDQISVLYQLVLFFLFLVSSLGLFFTLWRLQQWPLPPFPLYHLRKTPANWTPMVRFFVVMQNDQFLNAFNVGLWNSRRFWTACMMRELFLLRKLFGW